MRSLVFALGLFILVASNSGDSLFPEGGHSAKSALPNVFLGLIVLVSGENARLVGTISGIGLMCGSILWPKRDHEKTISSIRRGLRKKKR
jgi:hypothetical protein